MVKNLSLGRACFDFGVSHASAKLFNARWRLDSVKDTFHHFFITCFVDAYLRKTQSLLKTKCKI